MTLRQLADLAEAMSRLALEGDASDQLAVDEAGAETLLAVHEAHADSLLQSSVGSGVPRLLTSQKRRVETHLRLGRGLFHQDKVSLPNHFLM